MISFVRRIFGNKRPAAFNKGTNAWAKQKMWFYDAAEHIWGLDEVPASSGCFLCCVYFFKFYSVIGIFTPECDN